MAVTVVRGNIFNSRCTTLVNTVNCSGFMGRGIALEFRLRYSDMFEKYVKICASRQLKPGRRSPFIHHHFDRQPGQYRSH